MLMRACEEVCTCLGSGKYSGSGNDHDDHDVDRTIPRWRRSQLLIQDDSTGQGTRHGYLVQLR